MIHSIDFWTLKCWLARANGKEKIAEDSKTAEEKAANRSNFLRLPVLQPREIRRMYHE